MPDRSLRLHMLPPQPVQGREHSGMLLRERPASPPDAPSGGENGDERGHDGRTQDDRGRDGRTQDNDGRGGRAQGDDGRGGQAQDGLGRGGRRPREDNPFAPPPEGTPDRPWQPRRPAGEDGSQGSGSGEDGGHSHWGNQWSDRQPGRSPGGFGDRPRGGQDGPGGGGPGTGLRWDPTDPAQRRARYALLSGMWAFFFALFSWPYVALLLGALALYWGISSLRTKPRTPDPNTPAPQPTGRPQTTAAVSGLVTASLALAVVAAGFTAQVVYSDYYTCTSDALTNEAKQSCNELLPEELRGVLGNEG